MRMRVLTKRPLYGAHVGLFRKVSFQGLFLKAEGRSTGKQIIIIWQTSARLLLARKAQYREAVKRQMD